MARRTSIGIRQRAQVHDVSEGEVVGVSIATPSNPSYHAWLWDGSQLVDLRALSSYSAFGCGFAVNNRGQVLVQQVLWDHGTPTGPIGLRSVTMNQRGIVVGQVSIAREVDHAAAWQDGQVTDLGAPNTLGDPASSPASRAGAPFRWDSRPRATSPASWSRTTRGLRDSPAPGGRPSR